MKNTVFVLWFTLFSSLENFMQSHDTCQGELCSKENFMSEISTNDEDYKVPASEISPDFHFAGNSNILSSKEIYYMGNSEVPLYQSSKESITTVKFEELTSTELQSIFESTEKINLLLDDVKELSNSSIMTEFDKFTPEDSPVSKVTAEFTTSNINSLSTFKQNVPTTQIPFTASHLPVEKSSKKKDICFCDLQVNQCDINCCCDEDCSIFHFKIFTKCIEEDIPHDRKYCYKSNFIFGNNTSSATIRSSGDLFCIVRENLIHNLNYKTEIITTLEAFNISLPKNLYAFSYKNPEKLQFKNSDYLVESPVWTFINGEVTPFKIQYSTVGLLCNSEQNIKYLVDEEKICYYQPQPAIHCGGKSRIDYMFHYLKNIKIISNPSAVNQSDLSHYSKVCSRNMCIGINLYLCQNVDSKPNCNKISENAKDFSGTSCWSALSHVQYKFWHNGSEGIMKTEAFLWVKKLTKISEESFVKLITEVRYAWVGSHKKVFKKSGNPGYLTGKPILAGKKIHMMVNGTADKKEAIELSFDSKDWLSVLGPKKGICSSSERIPINFRVNTKFMCSIKLTESNFTKENCIELQNNIFNLLIGSDVVHEAKENFFNKFVATYGNSKVEVTGDWVQVLIDFFPIISSQPTFKSNHYLLMCKNIITDLYIDIIYSRIGSFLTPQAKILGVSVRFGTHKDLTYYCDSPGCENTSLVQYFTLSSAVRFVDASKPAVDAFSEPLSLEAKLPNDFFYPFFSNSLRSQVLNKLVLIAVLSVFL